MKRIKRKRERNPEIYNDKSLEKSIKISIPKIKRKKNEKKPEINEDNSDGLSSRISIPFELIINVAKKR